MIKHHPIFDTRRVIDVYSKKDGVPIYYVCTTALDDGTTAGDVFFRETPHPEFGNRYFRLSWQMVGLDAVQPTLMIGNADIVEDLNFDMIKGSGGWEYSQHRHDLREVPGTGLAIDGGRAYCRLVGNNMGHESRSFQVINGKMK